MLNTIPIIIRKKIPLENTHTQKENQKGIKMCHNQNFN